MKIYKQIPDERRMSFFILGSFFVLFLILSFSSINSVYGYDSEVISNNNIDTSLSNDFNQNNLLLDDNLDSYDQSIHSYNESIRNNLNEPSISRISSVMFISDALTFNYVNSMFNYADSGSNSIGLTFNYVSSMFNYADSGSNSIGLIISSVDLGSNSIGLIFSSVDSSPISVNRDTSISLDSQYSILQSVSNNSYLKYQMDYSTNDTHLNANHKNTAVYYRINNDDCLEKTEEQFTKLDNIDFNNIYYIFQYYNYDFNNDNYFNDINNHINYNVVFLTSSSDFKGTSFKNIDNFIKEVSNLNLNKNNANEDTSIDYDFQSSCYKPTVTILFFIKIFMDHHDNGKEHLNSFLTSSINS